MKDLLQKLGLQEDATEEQALAKLKELEDEKSKLDAKVQELTASETGLKADLEKTKSAYESLVEEGKKKEEAKQPKDIFEELSGKTE